MKKQKIWTGFSFLLCGNALDKISKKTLACSKNAEMLDMYGRPYLLDIISVFIEIRKGQALSSLLKSQQKMASSHKEHKS